MPSEPICTTVTVTAQEMQLKGGGAIHVYILGMSTGPNVQNIQYLGKFPLYDKNTQYLLIGS